MAAGRLIAIEGIDGAGKTTQVELLAGAVRVSGREVVVTKEPTTGRFGQQIRELSTAGRAPSPSAQLDLFCADRAEHVREVIAPALARGAFVITDRYYLSNVAYQAAAGLDPSEILVRNERQFPIPDAAVLIVVTPEEGLRRVRSRGGELNQTFERADFLETVAHVFASLTCPYIHRVDGERPAEVVHSDVRRALKGVVDLAPD